MNRFGFNEITNTDIDRAYSRMERGDDWQERVKRDDLIFDAQTDAESLTSQEKEKILKDKFGSEVIYADSAGITFKKQSKILTTTQAGEVIRKRLGDENE